MRIALNFMSPKKDKPFETGDLVILHPSRNAEIMGFPSATNGRRPPLIVLDTGKSEEGHKVIVVGDCLTLQPYRRRWLIGARDPLDITWHYARDFAYYEV